MTKIVTFVKLCNFVHSKTLEVKVNYKYIERDYILSYLAIQFEQLPTVLFSYVNITECFTL